MAEQGTVNALVAGSSPALRVLRKCGRVRFIATVLKTVGANNLRRFKSYRFRSHTYGVWGCHNHTVLYVIRCEGCVSLKTHKPRSGEVITLIGGSRAGFDSPKRMPAYQNAATIVWWDLNSFTVENCIPESDRLRNARA